jgi:hypothetical protein
MAPAMMTKMAKACARDAATRAAGFLLAALLALTAWGDALAAPPAHSPTYPLAPTGQRACYDTDNRTIPCPARGQPLYGQDAQFATKSLRYRDNGDGTITDLNTGLVWQQSPGSKLTWDEAAASAHRLRLAGHDDWRMPSIKELYSLMDFSGRTPRMDGANGSDGRPFIDTKVFDFRFGDTATGERIIDCQYWSATEYRGRTMGGNETVFGVNFADGRIKGYPKAVPGRGAHRMYVRYVRGNPAYGDNDFVDNGDGTITDRATGLMWLKGDSGNFKAGPWHDGRMDWPTALAWASTFDYAGHRDWRLPNAKELQSIVDYTRSPQATGGPAITPVFSTTRVKDEGNRDNYPFYWTSTTHLDGPRGGDSAVYVAFGEALGYMRFPRSPQATLMDVHGAGAQRSDPKQGNPDNFPQGRGPQGDVIRIYNFVRLVRDAR